MALEIPNRPFTFLNYYFSVVGALLVSQWGQEPWEPVDNRRIFMHGVVDRGDLNARQSCAAESSAKHNSNRSVQIFLRISPECDQSKLPEHNTWHTIFKNYPNVNVIFFNETHYFKETALENWYNHKEWEKSPQKGVHLSEFARLISLFRGGGLFIDMDTVVTLKPLNEHKWWNFFIKSSLLTHTLVDPTHIPSNEIFHLVYGHHLSDEIILNMGLATYNVMAPANELLNTAIQESIINICSNEQTAQKRKNHCKDVQLFNRRDVFVPQFESVFWRPIMFAFKRNINKRKEYENNMAIQSVIKNIFDTISAPLFTWKSSGQKHSNVFMYEAFISVILPSHCPLTVEYFSSIESWIV